MGKWFVWNDPFSRCREIFLWRDDIEAVKKEVEEEMKKDVKRIFQGSSFNFDVENSLAIARAVNSVREAEFNNTITD